jgi:hypothetical protein
MSAAYSGAFRRHLDPRLGSALILSLIALGGLLANGRPIGAGDTRPTERVAASLVRDLDFDLDEFPEITPPFVREVGKHRLSPYPVLSAVLATPVFFAAQALFALDETGTALAGKIAAAILASLAAGSLFLAIGRRHLPADASRAVLLFVFGTSVWSTSQALWQHPAAVFFLCLSVLCIVRAEEDAVWAGRAGLPLALAVAARHAVLPLAVVLSVGVVVRWPRSALRFAAWSAPAAAFVLAYQWFYFGSPLAHGFSGSLLERFDAPWGVGHLGLLLSPAKGLLVFSPIVGVAAWGLVGALRRPDTRPLALLLGLATVAHWIAMGRWREWHGGDCWGPRLMTDALPLLLFFLPEGLARAGRLGSVLAAVSVAVQALGAFSYDYRWERLHRAAAEPSALWQIEDSPIPFHARERVAILALPKVHEGRSAIHRYPLVVWGPTGSRIDFSGGGVSVTGEPPTLQDVHLQRRASVSGASAKLRGRWAALFMRVRSEARARPLQLQLQGFGQGTLYVGESSFWSRIPRWTTYSMKGAFDIRHDYDYPDSGGGDLLVTLGRAGGEADLASATLASR